SNGISTGFLIGASYIRNGSVTTSQYALGEERRPDRQVAAPELLGDAEDVEPVVREDRVASHGTGPIRCEEDGDVPDLFLGDIAAKRCLLDHEIARLRDAAHSAAGQGLERSGGDRVHSDVVWAEIRREVPRLRLENCLRHGHRGVARHDAFDRVVREARYRSAS